MLDVILYGLGSRVLHERSGLGDERGLRSLVVGANEDDDGQYACEEDDDVLFGGGHAYLA